MNYRLEVRSYIVIMVLLLMDVKRVGGTELAFEDKRYADIDDFIRVNSSWCKYPFKNDNAVSLSQVRYY